MTTIILTGADGKKYQVTTTSQARAVALTFERRLSADREHLRKPETATPEVRELAAHLITTWNENVEALKALMAEEAERERLGQLQAVEAILGQLNSMRAPEDGQAT